MIKILLIPLAASVLFLAGQAQALTLTNRDSTEQRLQVSDGEEEDSRIVVIEPDQTLENVCIEDCTIALENGTEMTFDGYEVVYIRRGSFFIAE